MAVIKVLKDEQLSGTADTTDVYPVTHTDAVYTSNGEVLTDVLSSLNNASDKMLKYEGGIVVISASGRKDVTRVDDSDPRIIIQGTPSAKYPDGSNKNITWTGVTKMTKKSTGSTSTIQSSSNNYSYEWNRPWEYETYTFKKEYTIEGRVGTVSSSSASMVITMPILYGFSNTKPTSASGLKENSLVAKASGVTLTFSANTSVGSTAYMYILIPTNLSVNPAGFYQPDASNAKLPFTSEGKVSLQHAYPGGKLSLEYNVYRSPDKIQTSRNKRITLA